MCTYVAYLIAVRHIGHGLDDGLVKRVKPQAAHGNGAAGTLDVRRALAHVLPHLDLKVVPTHEIVRAGEVLGLITNRRIELLCVIAAEL